MFRRRSTRRPRRYNRKSKTGKYSKKYAKKLKLVRTIQRVVGHNIETKYVAQELVTDGYVWGALTGTSDNFRFFSLIPSLGRGADSYQRVGNQITPISLAHRSVRPSSPSG